MNINTRPRFSNYKNLFLEIPKPNKFQMQNLPSQYISGQNKAQAAQDLPKIEPRGLSPLQYSVLHKMKLFISPFHCPTDFLTHFSMQPYKGKNAVLTLRHFVPKQAPGSGGFIFDSNLLVFKWFVTATEMSPFDDQIAYLSKIKASSDVKNYTYFLMAFEMGFILKREVEQPQIRFVQPNATKALSNEELDALMASKFASSGIDMQALAEAYTPLALEGGEEEQTPTPKGHASTPEVPKKKTIVPAVAKKITKENKEKKVSSRKKNGEKVLETDSEVEEMIKE